MTSIQELSARAALCRQLARLEPDSKSLWLAEADRWTRLTQVPNLQVVPRHDGPAESWCRKTMPMHKRSEVPFEFRNAAKAAERDGCEELSDKGFGRERQQCLVTEYAARLDPDQHPFAPAR